MSEKKHLKTFKEFIEERKKQQSKSEERKVDWELRKSKWIHSVNTLYSHVDNLIVKSFQDAGIKVSKVKEKTNLHEDYIGSYEIDNYTITADDIKIKFFPMGTIILGAYGRVNMLLPSDTVKLVLEDWDIWKIVTGMGSSMKLIDFNEHNIVKLLQENL